MKPTIEKQDPAYSLLLDHDACAMRGSRRQKDQHLKWIWGLALLLAISAGLNVACLALQSDNQKLGRDVSVYSPILGAVPQERVRWNETFYYPTMYPSPFAGYSSESNATWARFTQNSNIDGRNGTIALSRTDLERLSVLYEPSWLASAVELHHGGETRYMATLELFHHIHCLSRLRDVVLNGGAETYAHLEHCLETLREALMCQAGNGVVVFHWMDDQDDPYPDFNTYHACRNPERVLSWALEHTVPITGPIKKPQGVTSLRKPPY